MKSPSLSVKANRLNVNGVTAALLRKGVLRQLSQLRHGQLVIIEDGERQVFGAREAHLLGRSRFSTRRPGAWWRPMVQSVPAKRLSTVTGPARTLPPWSG